MAEKRQPKQDASPDSTRGGGQAVVSLCKVSESGLVFWSRHRFELAAELQVRVRCDVLPLRVRAMLEPDIEGWVSVRGFVIECRAQRRSNGAGVFRVSLLLDAALISAGRRGSAARSGDFWGGRWGRLFGLN
jgi:hypothetical protein